MPFFGAKERHEKIERLTTPMVMPFTLVSYITASAVENGTRNRTAHQSSGGAILAPFGLEFSDPPTCQPEPANPNPTPIATLTVD
uniref:Uncharacterized protein n=1 Tax=Tanacetum cinerariifolium TaxID=118510 RepID=A0A699J2J6_TANCI|nr:hypothetical protein [Tanacetum cinerariifolium]